MYNYIVRDKEAGNIIDKFETLEEAEKAITNFESQDIDDKIYTPNFYEIIEI